MDAVFIVKHDTHLRWCSWGGAYRRSSILYRLKIHREIHTTLKLQERSNTNTRTRARVYCNLRLMALVIFGPRKWVPGIVMHPQARRCRIAAAAKTQCTALYAQCLYMPLYNLSKSFFAKLNHVEDERKITKYAYALASTCILRIILSSTVRSLTLRSSYYLTLVRIYHFNVYNTYIRNFIVVNCS